jgi:hypothetical protein
MSDISIRSVQFPVVLVAAALVGWGIGSFLGSMGSAGPSPTPSATPSPSPSASASPTPTPTVSPSPTSSAPAGTEPPPPATILELSGSANKVSPDFEVLRGWQIVWQTDGDRFSFAVRGDQDLGTVVDQTGPASGVTSLAPAGMFHIEVTAKGPWSIKVLQGQG